VRERARFTPRQVREVLSARGVRQDRFRSYLLFPLDLRFIYYETEAKFLNESRADLGDNLSDNRFLVAVPQARRRSESLPLLASCLFDLHLHDRGSVGFPIHVEPEARPATLFSEAGAGTAPVANLAPPAAEALAKAWAPDGDRGRKPLVLDLFHLTLAVAHAPQYQLDHQDALAHDWIHLPIPKERATFLGIAAVGRQVAALLDPLADATPVLEEVLGADRRTLAVTSSAESEALGEADLVVSVSYFGSARGGWQERAPREKEASEAGWGEATGDLFLNDTAYLANVPERVWRYELGGYPVIKKWLGYRDAKRRPGRGLTLDELDHLRGIVHRIAALLRLHPRLDAAYEQAIADPFTSDDLGL
jgi:hypothetical protein